MINLTFLFSIPKLRVSLRVIFVHSYDTFKKKLACFNLLIAKRDPEIFEKLKKKWEWGIRIFPK